MKNDNKTELCRLLLKQTNRLCESVFSLCKKETAGKVSIGEMEYLTINTSIDDIKRITDNINNIR